MNHNTARALIESKIIDMGITRKEAARRIGITAAHICDITSGRRRVTRAVARKMEEELGADPGALDIAEGRLPPMERREDVGQYSMRVAALIQQVSEIDGGAINLG